MITQLPLFKSFVALRGREILTLSREERGSERGIYRHARSSRDDDLDDDRFLGSITLSFFLRGEINKLRGR